MKHSVSVTCCALLVSSISLSYAAEVPSGTVLAEKQELVRHIKDEPASLDPAKAVGLPEIQVIRDLFEGLVNQNEKGEIVPKKQDESQAFVVKTIKKEDALIDFSKTSSVCS